MTLTQGRKYRASIRLGMFESVASNEAIQERLESAGFVSVSVSGSGRTRVAEGTWGWPTQDAEMPSQIVASSVQVVG